MSLPTIMVMSILVVETESQRCECTFAIRRKSYLNPTTDKNAYFPFGKSYPRKLI